MEQPYPDSSPDLRAAVNARIRKSPFFDATVAAGLASVTTYNQMWLPASYGDPAAEYRRLTEGVSMWDVTAQRHLEVAGPDADRLVQRVTCVDATATPVGGGRYAPMTDADGRLINDPVLLRFDDGTWRFSIADADVRLWLDALVHAGDLDCTVTELDTATLAIQGPRTTEVIDALGLPSLDDAEHFARRSAVVDGIAVLVSKSGWSTQGGCELFLDDPTRALDLWDAVAAAGEPFHIGPGAPNQTERIENVLLSYGTDGGYDADPFELGLDEIVDLDGDDFIGRNALRAIAETGPARRLRGVVVEGEPIDTLPHPRPLTTDAGDRCGELRIAVRSPRWEANIGLAMAGSEIEPGATVFVDVHDRRRAGEVVALPFTDHFDRR